MTFLGLSVSRTNETRDEALRIFYRWFSGGGVEGGNKFNKLCGNKELLKVFLVVVLSYPCIGIPCSFGGSVCLLDGIDGELSQ